MTFPSQLAFALCGLVRNQRQEEGEARVKPRPRVPACRVRSMCWLDVAPVLMLNFWHPVQRGASRFLRALDLLRVCAFTSLMKLCSSSLENRSLSLRLLEPVLRIPVHRSEAYLGLVPVPCPLANLRTLSCLWAYDLSKVLFNN